MSLAYLFHYIDEGDNMLDSIITECITTILSQIIKAFFSTAIYSQEVQSVTIMRCITYDVWDSQGMLLAHLQRKV